MSPDCPLARSEGLIIEELDGELLVYDSDSNMAHALDAEVAALWLACDGHTDTNTLAERWATSQEYVQDILGRLRELGLMAQAQAGEDGDTRRSALRKIGIVGVGVASASAIRSILVPAAAAASSCQPGGVCVTSADQCCSGQTFQEPPREDFCSSGQAACCNPAGTCVQPGLQQFTCCNGSELDPTCPPSAVFPFSGYRCL